MVIESERRVPSRVGASVLGVMALAIASVVGPLLFPAAGIPVAAVAMLGIVGVARRDGWSRIHVVCTVVAALSVVAAIYLALVVLDWGQGTLSHS